jgi:hypothetical protein
MYNVAAPVVTHSRIAFAVPARLTAAASDVHQALRFILTLVALKTTTDVDDFMISTFFKLFTKTVVLLGAILISIRPLSHQHRVIALIDAIVRTTCLCLVAYNVTKACHIVYTSLCWMLRCNSLSHNTSFGTDR